MDFKIGDWVKSYSQGFWRIERIISDFYEKRYSTDKPKVKSKETQVILKRLVNDKWKRSFSMESCDSTYLKKISTEEMIDLQNFIQSNEKTMKDFEKYQRNIDLVMNIRFSCVDESDFDLIADELFAQLITDEKGLTSDEIITILEKSTLFKFMHKIPQNKTLQFVSDNLEVVNQEFFFRRYNVLNQ